MAPILIFIREPDGGSACLEDFVAAHHEPDGSPGLGRELDGEWFEVDRGLAAEAAADFGGGDVELARRPSRAVVAVIARIEKWPWDETNRFGAPSWPASATQAWGSM